MNQTWNQFLNQAGAVFDGGSVHHFGDPDSERESASRGAVICDLSHRGLIAVGGADALDFLQGQLSCNVDELGESCSRLGAWCSPKGRVLSLFRIVLHGDEVLMELPAVRLGESLKRLRLYVLRAKVSVEDASDRLVRIGLAGEAAAELIRGQFGRVPAAADEVVPAGNGRIVRLHGDPPRFQYFGEPQAAIELWRKSADALTPVGAGAWTLLDILAGVPEVSEADQHLPQMINLDLLSGVSFTKGCFVGQEVIARTQNLGRLKRRMYLVRVGGGVPAVPGTRILDAADDGDSAGTVLVSAAHPDGALRALAVLRIDAATSSEDLRLGELDGPPVVLLDPPYALDTDAR